VYGAFKYFDPKNTGYITKDNFLNALKSNNLAINEEELEVFFKQDKNKKITYEDFKHMISDVYS